MKIASCLAFLAAVARGDYGTRPPTPAPTSPTPAPSTCPLYVIPAAPQSPLQLVPGKLAQVSFHNGILCGVNAAQNIFCDSANLPGNPNWMQLAGGLSQVIVFNGVLYGVNSANNIYFAPVVTASPAWVQLPGQLKSISYDGYQLCGASPTNQVFCASQGLTTAPVWVALPGSLKQVVVNNGRLYGVDVNNILYTSPSDNYNAVTWTKLPGTFSQVSYDGLRLCGVTSSNSLYCADDRLTSTPNWTQIRGSLTNVAIFGRDLYATAPDASLYHGTFDDTKCANPPPSPLQVLPGLLTQVSSSNGIVCGTNLAQQAYCANANLQTSPNWFRVNGAFTQIIVFRGVLYAVDVNRNVYYAPQVTGNPAWVKLTGSLKWVSFDGLQLCGVNSGNQAFCADQDLATAPNWTLLPGGTFKQIEVYQGRVYGVHPTKNTIYTATSTNMGACKWTQVAGSLAQITYDGCRLCGVTNANSAWCADKGLTSAPNWYRVHGSLFNIEIAPNALYGVSGDQSIWYAPLNVSVCPAPPANQPTLTPGNLVQVSYHERHLCGVDANQNPFCASSDLFTKPNWIQLAGKLTQIVVRNGVLYGVNAGGAIFYAPAISPSPAWVQLPGTLKRIAFDGAILCGVSHSNTVFCANQGLTTSPNWVQIPGTFSQILVREGIFFAVHPNGDIFTAPADNFASVPWVQIPGSLAQISFDGCRLCGITSSYGAYCTDDLESPNWYQIQGPLTSVAIYNQDLFGTSPDGSVYHLELAPTQCSPVIVSPLQVVPGNLVQTSFHNGVLCGVDQSQKIYCSSSYLPDNPSWTLLKGSLVQVQVYNGALYGVNAGGAIFYAPCIDANPAWVQLPGGLKQVAFDGSILWGINSGNNLFFAKNGLPTSPSWVLLPGSYKHFAVADGRIYAVDVNNNVFTATTNNLPSLAWTQLSNTALAQVAFDGTNLCGLSSANRLWCAAKEDITVSPVWFQIPGASSTLTVSNGEIYSAKWDGTIYYYCLDAAARAVASAMALVSVDTQWSVGPVHVVGAAALVAGFVGMLSMRRSSPANDDDRYVALMGM